MRIGGINGANPRPGQAGMQQQTDSVSKNIQKQIANKQKELQNLSSNNELDMEAKGKKRQAIMQEINDLNNQLRQHQIEQRREQAMAQKKQSGGSSVDELTGGGARKAGKQGSMMSQSSMKAVISAESALKQAQVQGSAANGLENQAHILKSEIEQDKGRTDVTKKEEELARKEERAAAAAASQMDTLSEAGEKIEEAAEAERNNAQAGKKPEKTQDDKSEKKPGKIGQKADKAEKKTVEIENQKADDSGKTGKEKSVNQTAAASKYPSVDIYL
ncbi:MAG: hypothetical protein HFH48_02300 [Lachnospiraceae bacterium]|nr:hypothetical protein [Lachnospiraceae bacterium]